jgi:hypothetical protein
MDTLQRISPVELPGTPLKTQVRDHWQVALEYPDEDQGPYIVDLSHRPRLDLQSSDLASCNPFGMAVPDFPGRSLIANGILANRMNRTQVSLYHLDGEQPVLPQEPEYTEVTEATLFIALIGAPVFSICEKLTALDFLTPDREPPFLYQGPFAHLPCQIVTLSRDADAAGLVLTCSRGYGRDMIHAIMAAGEEYGLRPAGERRFTQWFQSL